MSRKFVIAKGITSLPSGSCLDMHCRVAQQIVDGKGGKRTDGGKWLDCELSGGRIEGIAPCHTQLVLVANSAATRNRVSWAKSSIGESIIRKLLKGVHSRLGEVGLVASDLADCYVITRSTG